MVGVFVDCFVLRFGSCCLGVLFAWVGAGGLFVWWTLLLWRWMWFVVGD